MCFVLGIMVSSTTSKQEQNRKRLFGTLIAPKEILFCNMPGPFPLTLTHFVPQLSELQLNDLLSKLNAFLWSTLQTCGTCFKFCQTPCE